MYLHLGQDVMVRTGEIVGIFDIENVTVKRSGKYFLSVAEKNGLVKNVSDELPKTFIVCEREGKTTVYISQISSMTLKKRTAELF